MQKLIFVSGTGRSGTHLIGRTLSSHPDIKGRIEEPKTFQLITKIATTQDLKNPLHIFLLKQLLEFRLKRILKKSSTHILEKSHPSLWLIDYLISKFNSTYFVGVYREVEPTVNSMLQHRGVLSWYKNLPQDEKNRFLGITESNKNVFDSYSLEEKCALRWLSHKKELFRLKKKYPSKIYIIKYDVFLTSPELLLSEISTFLNLTNNFNPEKFKLGSLNKWKNELSEAQIQNIHKVVKIKQNKVPE